MPFSVENDQENDILGRESLYSGYGVKRAYEDGKIFMYLFYRWHFPISCLMNGICHVDYIY